MSRRTHRPGKRELALGAFSHTEPLPEAVAPRLLHEIFEETARRFPHRVAIEHRSRRLTYAELDALSERVADGLREHSVGPGARVAIQMERSIETHAALLGIMKAGAAYVPLDVECPDDRVRFVLADCRASLIVRSTALADAGCRVVDFSRLLASGAGRPAPARATAQDACYVIYTSGSTGRPKGVEIAHRSAAHLVWVEHRMFGVVPSDRVLQGFSLSFDAAVEEIWLAFAAGAALVVVDKPQLLESFGSVVTNQGLTVVSTVPTLLAGVREPMPRLRLLIVGGEACPQSLVERFARGRRMVNTYGPTEATVIATATDLRPGEPVTIGRPIANYRVYLLGPNKQPVAPGTVGEIHIGGPGLALGYVGHARTLPSPFITCPFAGEWGAPSRLYATGDLGRHTTSGDIEFLGRADQQVKLRGVRIELGEVEEAAASLEGVAQCVVALQRVAEHDALVAYVVLRPGAAPDVAQWSREVRRRLPATMVPSHWEVLTRVPTLPSGKVDRSALPKPRAGVASVVGAKADGLEARIAREFGAMTGVVGVTPQQDFFLDLGGHSLLAARLVSRLRAELEMSALSLRDLYDHSTPRRLARFVASTRPEQAPAVAPPTHRRRSTWAVAAQAVGVHALAVLHAAQWLGPYLVFLALCRAACPLPWAALLSVCTLLALHPCMLLGAVAIKWLVVGRYRAGSYPIWGQMHLRHWFVDRVLALAPVDSLRGTPLLNVYLRMLGARIGADVTIATTRLNAFDLLSVEDGATLSIDALVTPATLRAGELVLGAVTVGAKSVVGVRATVVSGDHVESASEVAPLGHVGGASTLHGGRAHAETPSYARFVVGALGLQVVPLAAILPGLVALRALEAPLGVAHLLAAPAVALVFVLLVCAQLVALKRLLGKTSPGTHSLRGAVYFKHWLFAQAQRTSFEWVGSLYATVFTPWLYRLLGAKVGQHTELSTASDFEPDLLHVGAESFVADAVSLGAPRLEAGEIVLSHTRVGQGAFIGNGAVVPSGASIGENALIGCMSRAPLFAPDRSSWMGAPALRLSRRQASAEFSADSTFRPTRRLVALRAIIEGVRVIAPATGVVVFAHALVAASDRMLTSLGPLALAVSFPTIYFVLAAVMACSVVAAKWCLVGRHRARETPLFSHFVWRTELATSLHENLVDPMLNELLKGTPWLPWFFRALGAKIGRDVTMMTTQLTEYDLVEIGDGACLDDDCTLQTHLFEDRVMKTSTVRVGSGCTVGAGSVVLYDTTMAPGSVLQAGSLLMKGETLPPSTAWIGVPASAPRTDGVIERILPLATAAAFVLALGATLSFASRAPMGYEASNRVDALPSAHGRPLVGGGLL